jgi:hypothetical protein
MKVREENRNIVLLCPMPIPAHINRRQRPFDQSRDHTAHDVWRYRRPAPHRAKMWQLYHGLTKTAACPPKSLTPLLIMHRACPSLSAG